MPQPEKNSRLASDLSDAGFVFEGSYVKARPAGWFLHNPMGTNPMKASSVRLQLCNPQGRVVAVITGRFTEQETWCRMDPPNDEIFIRQMK